MFTWTFYIHKVGVWALHKALLFVLSPLILQGGVQQVFSQLGRARGQSPAR